MKLAMFGMPYITAFFLVGVQNDVRVTIVEFAIVLLRPALNLQACTTN